MDANKGHSCMSNTQPNGYLAVPKSGHGEAAK